MPDEKLSKLRALGQPGSRDLGGQLEVFECPKSVSFVSMTSDEVTAVCPVTGQPDLYVVTCGYYPAQLCIESKSLKLYFTQYRNRGIFCEAFAAQVAQDIYEATKAPQVQVRVTQKPRGGITIEAIANLVQGTPVLPLEVIPQ